MDRSEVSIIANEFKLKIPLTVKWNYPRLIEIITWLLMICVSLVVESWVVVCC
jgi:hypothetical protein